MVGDGDFKGFQTVLKSEIDPGIRVKDRKVKEMNE